MIRAACIGCALNKIILLSLLVNICGSCVLLLYFASIVVSLNCICSIYLRYSVCVSLFFSFTTFFADAATTGGPATTGPDAGPDAGAGSASDATSGATTTSGAAADAGGGDGGRDGGGGGDGGGDGGGGGGGGGGGVMWWWW